MTGYKPNFELLESLGVEFEEDDFRTPVYDSKTMQSNQTGFSLLELYVGDLKPTNGLLRILETTPKSL